MAANWAELHEDLVVEITKRLTMENLVCFSEVCKPWRRVAMAAEQYYYCSFEGPWLMQIHKKHQEEEDEKDEKDEAASPWREFISVSLGGKVRRVFLPELVNRNCLSCKDWLFTISEDHINPSLLHPLSRTQICLPNLKSLPLFELLYNLRCSWTFVYRVVISADARRCSLSDSKDELIVVVVTGNVPCDISFCKPGRDTSWTQILHESLTNIRDIIYFNNKLYALDCFNYIYRCDFNGENSVQLRPMLDPDRRYKVSDASYLVECCGKLLVVMRYMNFLGGDEYITSMFKVYEVKLIKDDDGNWMELEDDHVIAWTNSEDGPSWTELKDLGNRALFLGGNTSCLIECSKFNKVKPNSIYFTDERTTQTLNRLKHGRDTGIYNLSDGSFTRFSIDEKDVVLSQLSPPLWIGPSF